MTELLEKEAGSESGTEHSPVEAALSSVLAVGAGVRLSARAAIKVILTGGRGRRDSAPLIHCCVRVPCALCRTQGSNRRGGRFAMPRDCMFWAEDHRIAW